MNIFGEAVVQRRNSSGAACDLIREAIISGRLQPGQRLKEEELGRDLEISRTPVREALLMLHAEGLVELTPRKGATVREFAIEDLENTYELRAWLEGYAAWRAAERIAPLRLRALKESCERFDKLLETGEAGQLVKENIFFHTTIIEAADSQKLFEMAKQLLNIPLIYRSYYWYSAEQRLNSERYHKQLVQAFETRQAGHAEMLMRAHILEAKEFLIKRRELAGE